MWKLIYVLAELNNDEIKYWHYDQICDDIFLMYILIFQYFVYGMF